MKPILVVATLILLAGLAVSFGRILPARASSNPRTQPVVATESCVDRYNLLVKSAKAALIAGDRAATVKLLTEAQRIIPICSPLQDGTSPQAAFLSLYGRDDAPVQKEARPLSALTA
jgi:hypothetical protein